MASYSLPFEKPIIELVDKLEELRKFSDDQNIDVSLEVMRMQAKIDEMRINIYSNLSPWQKVQVARHPLRPYTLDYIRAISSDFTELHGDRLYADDRAMIGGFATIEDERVVIIGTQKGRDTKSNLECNFGCAYPEGYRKALRLMKIADKFGLPIVTLIDTPGAFPGIESEERHIAEAIAVNLREMFNMRVPIVVNVIGEGGSGGALGIGVGDHILILEHAYYSVISPEGCAAILWKDRAFADKAAEALKLTAQHLKALDLVDQIIDEPVGGAHTNPEMMAKRLKELTLKAIKKLKKLSPEELREKRYEKFRAMGRFEEEIAPPPPEPQPEKSEEETEETGKPAAKPEEQSKVSSKVSSKSSNE